ncbi:MAG: TonB-dependent receptor [Marinicaulis sp.]|nr:TonB-dependent receptor [Marinicaulis sp.]
MKTIKSMPVRRNLLAATALTSVAAMMAPAFAQDDEDDTIIVTGSRLNQANLNSPSPVFQVDAGEIDTRGVTRVEDLLNILPQAFAAQTSELANGASGTSSLNLRGLGNNRTLVLIDGKRLPFGSPSFSAPNLDLVPTQLVERVDVVTGGASAVYGSDAIAGVANFVMQRDFEGIMFDGQVGAFQDSNSNEYAIAVLNAGSQPVPDGGLDGRDVLASITFGANTADGRGNVTAFFSYQNQNEIRQGARDYSACAYGPAAAGPTSIGGVACVGSSTFRRFGLSRPSDPTFPAGLFLNPDGTFVPFVGGVAQTFNFAPDNFIQRNNERFNFSAFARYELTDDVEAYLDFGFTNNTTDSQIAFSGTFFRNFMINCNNPMLTSPIPGGSSFAEGFLGCTPAQITTGLNPDGTAADVPLGGVGTGVGYRNVTGNPRSSFIGLQTYRAIGGLRGNLGDNWSWDAFGQFARTTQSRVATGDLNFQRLQDAFFIIDDGMGNAVCRSGNTGCVPFNVFQRGPNGENLVGQAATNYVEGNGFRNGFTQQYVIGGTIQGDLGPSGMQSPWADGGVQVLAGIEHRRDELNSQPDDVSQIPAGMGFTGVGGGTLPVAGEIRVTELFGEINIPIINGATFFDEFGINAAYRYSDYTTDGNGVQNSFDTHTFAAGVTWAMSPDIRLRGQFQRAVRAPNVIELFTGQNTGLFNASAGPNGLFDPCASGPGNVPPPQATAAQCAFTGVSAAQFGAIPDNPAGQLNAVTGGNPFLTPESSDTFTAGVVLTPGMVDGLSIAVDYFDISVDDTIATVPPQTALAQCLATGASQFCDLIQRDAGGTLFVSNTPPAGIPGFAGVQATNTNISNLSTRGLDLAANYSYDVGGFGSLSWNYAGTILFELSSVPVPGVTTTTECKGLYRGSCGGPNPDYRHRLLTTWQTPWDLDITATWRYYSGVTLDAGQSSGGTFTPTGNVLDDFLDSANYLDLSAQYHVNENIALRAGVQNVFGRDPELSTLAGTAPGNGDTFPGTYDPAGRFLFFGVNASL